MGMPTIEDKETYLVAVQYYKVPRYDWMVEPNSPHRLFKDYAACVEWVCERYGYKECDRFGEKVYANDDYKAKTYQFIRIVEYIVH